MTSYRFTYAPRNAWSVAVAGMAISAPTAPISAVPAITEPKATAGWMSTVLAVMRGWSR